MTATSIGSPAAYLDELRDRAADLAAVPHRCQRRTHAVAATSVRALLDSHQPAHRAAGGTAALRRGLLLRARAARHRAARLRDAAAFTATLTLAAAPMTVLLLLVGSGLAR